jgi:hypothetical protein
VKPVAFDWRDFLDFAKSLSADTREAAHRSAISRAYYAAYGHSFDYATRYLGFVPRNLSDDHGRLRNHLMRSRRRAIAEKIGQLRDWRNQADYAAEFGDDLATTLASALAFAEYVFLGLPKPSTPSR